ncbi:MAG: oligosaccharide flippase family protein [Planctomycetota bacterium]
MKSYVVSGAFWSTLNRGSAAVGAFAVNAILVLLLPMADVGAFMVAQGIVQVAASLALLGSNFAVIRYLPQPALIGCKSRNGVVTTTGLLGLAGTLLALILFVDPLRTRLWTLVGAPGVASFGLLMLVWFVSRVIRRFFSGSLRGLTLMRDGALSENVLYYGVLVVGLAGLWWSGATVTLERAIVAAVIGSVVAALYAIVALCLHIKFFPIEFAEEPSRNLKEAFSTSLPLLFLEQSRTFSPQLGLWLVAAYCNLETAAVFGLAHKVMQLMAVPTAVLTIVARPLVASLDADGEIERSEKGFRVLSTVNTVLTTLLLIAIVVLLPMLGSKIDAGYAAVVGVSVWLVLGRLVFAAFGPCDILLSMTGHERPLVKTWILIDVFVALGAFFAVGQFGAYGVAAALAFGFALKGFGSWRMCVDRMKTQTHLFWVPAQFVSGLRQLRTMDKLIRKTAS